MVLDAGAPPGNDQLKLVALAEDAFINVTLRGPQPLVGVAENPAVGGVRMVMVWVNVFVPQALVAVSTTVYVPSSS